MRRRILVVALSAVTVAILLFGIPLAIAIERNIVTQERNELERAALRAAPAVSPPYRPGDPVELPQPESQTKLGLYTTTGRRVSGDGPAALDAAALRARE